MDEKMLAKFRTAKSAEELAALARENGVQMSAEEAGALFTRLTSEIADEDMDMVSGGIKYSGSMQLPFKKTF